MKSPSNDQVVSPSISVVIPACDEVVAIGPLLSGIARAMKHLSYEIIVVDDGSTDGTHHALAAFMAHSDCLLVIRKEVSSGQSCAVRDGVRAARGDIIVTLDGDGQNPPDQIPLLLALFELTGVERLGLVQGERAHRQDTIARRLASQAANVIRRTLLHDGVRDSACGMKAFRRTAYFDLPWFDHIHRFMPAMMLREGWDVATVPVTHLARMGGSSKYSNFARALAGVPDLLGTAWLIWRKGRPGGRLLSREMTGDKVELPSHELRS